MATKKATTKTIEVSFKSRPLARRMATHFDIEVSKAGVVHLRIPIIQWETGEVTVDRGCVSAAIVNAGLGLTDEPSPRPGEGEQGYVPDALFGVNTIGMRRDLGQAKAQVSRLQAQLATLRKQMGEAGVSTLASAPSTTATW